jgi:hypothetical protein
MTTDKKTSVGTGKGLKYPDEEKGFRAIFDDLPTLQIALAEWLDGLPY